jgi:nucleoside-diphosphate-sugar epimerase
MLIVGATGVIGEAALAHFAAASDWNVIAVSRRTPEAISHAAVPHIGLDLTDPAACREASNALRDVTHVVYAAVSEQPGLIAGWQDPQQMQLNLDMLRNLIEPLTEVAGDLRHVTLMQGAKAYGAHAGHRPPLPARERAARVEHRNFYWLQEDYLREQSSRCDFAWTIFRPQVVVGGAWGAAMNPLLAIAAYAALSREEGKPFSYPGGELQVLEIVDASLIAEALEWAATSPQARSETFNITNGDVFAWREAWSVLADALGVELGADEPLKLATYLPARSALWDKIVIREGLRPLKLMQFLGESHHYADLLLRTSAARMERSTLLSTIKLRQAGFHACRDSEDVVRYWLRELQYRKLVPQPKYLRT